MESWSYVYQCDFRSRIFGIFLHRLFSAEGLRSFIKFWFFRLIYRCVGNWAGDDTLIYPITSKWGVMRAGWIIETAGRIERLHRELFSVVKFLKGTCIKKVNSNSNYWLIGYCDWNKDQDLSSHFDDEMIQ